MPRKPYTHHKKRKPFGRGFKRGHKCLDWGVMVLPNKSPCEHHGCSCGHFRHSGTCNAVEFFENKPCKCSRKVYNGHIL